MAGLWTARVLANRFAHVQIVERDVLPSGPEHRPGVPQSHQVHVLLMRGAEVMERLFPGITDELLDAGAVRFDLTGDSRTKMRGQWLEPFESGMTGLGVSRVLLESTIRRRLRDEPHIDFVDGAEVTGLQLAQPGSPQIGGVTLRRKSGDREAAETLTADFVVDASGRNSRTPQWLADLGYPVAETKIVTSFLGYACRRYRPGPHFGRDWQMMVVAAQPPHNPRSGILFPEENGTLMVMLGGANKDYPPTDEAGFLDFAHSLDLEFGQTVAEAKPIAPARGYRQTENRLNAYDQLERWPQRFVVLGDAYCAFNPIYGQGMTLAALSAMTLDEHLAQVEDGVLTLDNVAKPFQQALAQVAAPAWEMATGADEMWPLAEGGREGLPVQLSRWFNHQLGAAMPHDRVIHQTFMEVAQLTKPPGALVAPGILWRILRSRLRDGWGESAGEPVMVER